MWYHHIAGLILLKSEARLMIFFSIKTYTKLKYFGSFPKRNMDFLNKNLFHICRYYVSRVLGQSYTSDQFFKLVMIFSDKGVSKIEKWDSDILGTEPPMDVLVEYCNTEQKIEEFEMWLNASYKKDRYERLDPGVAAILIGVLKLINLQWTDQQAIDWITDLL